MKYFLFPYFYLCDICLTFDLFILALTNFGDFEGYGYAYIGPFNPALCHSASLMTEHWEAGLASPGCLDADWPNLPPLTPPTRVLFTVLRFFGWAHVSIITGEGLTSQSGWWGGSPHNLFIQTGVTLI